MKTCKRLINFAQLINAEGDVRACCWSKDNIIGNLQHDKLTDIVNSEKARSLRRMIAEGDYSNCPADNCPYQSNNNMDEILVDYKEDERVYPEELYLAYEGNCNYRCTCCSSYQHMLDTKQNDYTELYDKLEQNIADVLPYVKHLSANGRGEVFASPRIMKILSEWKPVAPMDEVSASIETNGSLFNEKNWEKIKNLGKYNLSVSVTVMSFDELTYQYLSGTKLPISNIESNLLFIKKLREEGVINYLEIATVMQELNFREMPSFTRRCLDEFGADRVRIRPIFWGGGLSREDFAFMDVRNPAHPYHDIYKQIMLYPIFQDARVLLWSGDLDSEGKKLSDNKLRTYIYGAGDYGRRLYSYLVDNGIFRINGFVQTKEPKANEYIDGIKVYTIDEISTTGNNRFLIAINNKEAVSEIRSNLAMKGFESVDYSGFVRDNLSVGEDAFCIVCG